MVKVLTIDRFEIGQRWYLHVFTYRKRRLFSRNKNKWQLLVYTFIFSFIKFLWFWENFLRYLYLYDGLGCWSFITFRWFWDLLVLRDFLSFPSDFFFLSSGGYKCQTLLASINDRVHSWGILLVFVFWTLFLVCVTVGLMARWYWSWYHDIWGREHII